MTAFENQPTPDAAERPAASGDVPASGAAPEGMAGGTPDGAPAAGGADGGVASAADPEVQRQLDEARDRHLRVAAEFENARRRWARERDETRLRAQADLVRHLLDALDDIGRFAHVDPATADAATVVQGVEMVEKKLMKLLTGAGLEVVDPAGQQFDPTLHEAVATEPTPAREDDHVVARVYQRGYRFGGQLLRPARVVVKQYTG